MGFLGKLANLFSRAGRDDNRLKQAMDHAEADRPDKAIEIYSAVIDSKATSAVNRARALFNRALAYSSQKDDAKAIADLEEIVKLPNTPENVLNAARTQLVRVRSRVERARVRTSR